MKFIAPLVLLVVLGGAYKTVLAKPAEKEPEPKVHGQLYVLPKEFLVNLAGDRYAKLTVALLLPETALAEAAEGGEEAAEPPEGFGTLPQEALVRGIVTDTLSGVGAARLLKAEGREAMAKRILRRLKKRTDVEVEEVVFTDIAVQ
jgi:flagellar FliL protein